jgi:hypothetical protein
LTRHQGHHTGTVEESIVAAEAALKTRSVNPPQRSRSDGATFSETGSTRSSPGSDRTLQATGDLQAPLLPRQPNDFGYIAGGLPPHLRADLTQNSPRSGSTSPSLSAFGVSTRPSFTSHPNSYVPPPPPLEPPTQNEQRTTGSANGSPHLSSIGWQTPPHHNIGSPVPGNGYIYPDPAYELTQPNIYYTNTTQRRPQSTEPDQYELKPRMSANDVWGSQLS